ESSTCLLCAGAVLKPRAELLVAQAAMSSPTKGSRATRRLSASVGLPRCLGTLDLLEDSQKATRGPGRLTQVRAALWLAAGPPGRCGEPLREGPTERRLLSFLLPLAASVVKCVQ